MELIAVFAPLIAFLLVGGLLRQISDGAAQFITCAGVIMAALASINLFFDLLGGAAPFTTVLATWISSGDFTLQWALRIDMLSVVMMCVINIVSACVHVYSIGYMSHDPAKARFMAYLSLFTFAMLMLVTADNLIQLFFGWEGVGLASYLLIGFWNHKDSANSAAQKAFLVNRVGDFGFALGIMAIFVIFGSVNFDIIFDQAEAKAAEFFTFFGYEVHALTLASLLLFIGAIGKSAQLGLHTWLPDAMEGPTPVSALIHAATMVTAGVFLVSRMSPVFEYAPEALMVVTVVGALTSIVAATIGMTQFDIKRVIAYSTMSQLGYMFFALGVSAYAAAMFHLVTHAFFKALLFLGAGSVIHGMSDEQDMRKMGGIWKMMPITYIFIWIGSLALAGIWPFAGFYSKDIVLEAAWADHTWFGDLAYWLGIAAAFITAFYSWRLIILTFHGKPRADKEVMSHVHESPTVMTAPLAVLAFGAIFSGMILYQGFVGSDKHHETPAHLEKHDPSSEIVFNVSEEDIVKPDDPLSDVAEADTSEIPNLIAEENEETLHEQQAKQIHNSLDQKHSKFSSKEAFWNNSLFVLSENDTVEAAHHVPFWVKKLPLLMGILGIALAYFIYMFRPGLSKIVSNIFKPLHALFFNKWYFDELYNALFVRPSFWFGNLFWKRGDQQIVDRFGPDGSACVTKKIAGLLSRFQSGYVFQYAFMMMVGLIALISWFVFKDLQGL